MAELVCAIRRGPPALPSVFIVEVPIDVNVARLKDAIKAKKEHVLGQYDADDLILWRLKKSFPVGSLGTLDERLDALGEVSQFATELDEPMKGIASYFPQPPLQGDLHIIVQKPDHNQPPNKHISKLETGTDIPEIIFKLRDAASFGHLSEENLRDNHVRVATPSLPHFQTLQEGLQRKRYIEVLELSCNLPQSYFESIIPTDADPLDRVTKGELIHHASVFNGVELLKMTNFTNDKEAQVRHLLLEFLGIVRLVQSGMCGFRSQFPFPLVVEIPGEKFSYTPRSDFHMRIRDFPHLLLQVHSQANGGDRYRMLLQASCLARLGNLLRASPSRGPIIIMAIYIDKDFVASQYLLCQPAVTSTEVQYVTKCFNLTDPKAAFQFIFELYNFVSAAKAYNDDLRDPGSVLALLKESVTKQKYPALTTTNLKRKREAAENTSHLSSGQPSPGAAQDSFGNQSVQENLVTAGYTLTQRISEELTPLTPLKPTMRQAASRSGISVVLKIIGNSNERRLLQYLSSIKAPSNHTIPLLEVIDLSIGKTIIVLPWKSPLDEVLQFRDRPDDVPSLCLQFVEGVAFLHQHNVAHCDLKPGNVVVDTKHESETLPRLFIIDFDLAQFVESEETMAEGWCGTPPWIAPELGLRDGPIQRYSPILADRWACGRMIKYFIKYIPAYDENAQNLLAFAQRLLSVNPRARPRLNQLQAINEPKKRRSARSQHEPVPKRPAVNRSLHEGFKAQVN